MARINDKNYIERRPFSGKHFGKWRGWWLGKASHIRITCQIPERLYGKRFRIKVEEMKK